MRDKKGKQEDNQTENKVQNELEISQTGYGLEAVAKGTDFAEGDKNNPPSCGGL